MQKYYVRTALALLTVVFAQFMTDRKAFGSSPKELVEQFRKQITQNESYEFATTKKVTIIPDQKAVLLKCSTNPEDINEILIGANQEHLFVYCIYASSAISGGGSTWKEGPGSFRQAGGSAAIAMWEDKDGVIDIQFQLTNDDNDIVNSYRKLEKAGKSFPNGRFSRTIKSWGALLDNPELMFPRLTATQRVEAFTRLWSEVKYNFANFDLVPDLNWDDVLSDYIPQVMREQSNNDFAKLLAKCIAKLKDGHTNVSMNYFDIFDLAQPALTVMPIEGKAIITEIGNSRDIEMADIKVGDEIVRIDNKDVREILEEAIYPYIFASTNQWRDDKAFRYLLRGPEKSEIKLHIKNIEGRQQTIILTRDLEWDKNMTKKDRNDFEYKDLGNGISYVAINTFGNSEIVKKFKYHMDKIRGSKGLIIDVRKNGGGNSGNGDNIVSFLIGKPIPGSPWKTPQHIAAFQAWGRPKNWHVGETEDIMPCDDIERFSGPIVALTGTESFSAAEDFLVLLHSSKRATLVGGKTGGSTGQPLQFEFDYGVSGRICTKRNTYPDGREFVGVGIIPDVEVHPTQADIAMNRDVVLEKGLEVLNSKMEQLN